MSPDSDPVSTHRIRYRYQRAIRLLALPFAIFAICGVLVMVFQRTGERNDDIFLGAFSLFFAAAAVLCFRWASTVERHTVRLSDRGISVGQGKWMGWDEISGVRGQYLLNRIDLLGASGERKLSVSYDVAEIDEVLARISEHVGRHSPSAATRFVRRFKTAYIIAQVATFAGFVALLLWTWLGLGQWTALLALPLLIWFQYSAMLTDLLEVTIDGDALFLRTVVRPRRISRADVRCALLVGKPLRSGRILTVAIDLVDGARLYVVPAGNDPARVVGSLQAWLAEGSSR